MSESADLIAAAKDAAERNVDYYTLLGLPSDSSADALTRDQIQRAWRKASFPYHPDKAGAAFSQTTWELYSVARDVLADPSARSTYDGARAAKLHAQKQRDLLSGQSRRFLEELEAAEKAGGFAAAQQRQQKKQKSREEETEAARLAEKGRERLEQRRRLEREAEEREKDTREREMQGLDDKERELERKIGESRARKAAKEHQRREKRGDVQRHVKEVTAKAPEQTAEERKDPDAAGMAGLDASGSREERWARLKTKLVASQAATDAKRRRETEARGESWVDPGPERRARLAERRETLRVAKGAWERSRRPSHKAREEVMPL